MSDDGTGGPPEGEGVVLIEGWMFGVLGFEEAVEHVLKFYPPANDNPPEG